MSNANALPRRSPRFVGAIDQGTTSTRFILFDESGSPVISIAREHKQYFPSSGLVEHDVEEIWECTVDVIRDALAGVGAAPSDLSSVGITNQRETIVVWHADTGKAYHNAIVWQDQRGAALCEELAAKSTLGINCFKEKTGLPLVPYFSASKLAWCLDNIPGLRADAEAGLALAGTIDSFLIWRLTRDANSSSSSSSSDKKSSGGLHVTDVSNASRTMLLNIHTLKWDAELCAAFRVPLRMLPSVVPSSGAVGKGAQFSPLPGVPIAGILGDQQAALFGQACFSPGDAKNTYGTGCFLLLNAGFNVPNPPTDSGLLTTIAYQRAGHPVVYALEGSVAVAGAAVSWLRDALKIIESPQEMEALAASVPDAGGSVLVPAFNGLFAPHWRSDARGAWVGLSAGVGRAHLARATLEAVAHQSRELLTSMERALGADAPRGALRVDGGMTANALLMQLQADYTGRRCVRPVVVETTALGAAYAAGLATGFWKDEAQLRAQWREDRSWVPQAKPEDVIKSCRDWDRALARTLYWQGGGADQALTLLPKAQNDLARKQLISLVGAFCTGALIATLGWIGMSRHLRRK